MKKEHFEICAYDFFRHGLVSEFDGVLGLDFFQDHRVCIDFRSSVLTIEP